MDNELNPNPNSTSIIFNSIELPKCPFLWNYENQYLHPIIEYSKIVDSEIIDGINEYVEKNLKNNVDKIKKIKKDYWIIKQKILFSKSEENKINLSFHSWYYSKISKSNDMTKIDFNIPLNTCILTDSLNIKEDEIKINELTKRKIIVHNKKLSPSNSNTFYICEHSPNLIPSQLEFYSVCWDGEIKQCVITKHVVFIEQ